MDTMDEDLSIHSTVAGLGSIQSPTSSLGQSKASYTSLSGWSAATSTDSEKNNGLNNTFLASAGLRPSRRSFGSFGKLKKSIPKKLNSLTQSFSSTHLAMMKGASSFGSLGSSPDSIEEEPLDQGGAPPHRIHSNSERSKQVTKTIVHQFDTGNLNYGVSYAPARKDQDRYDIRLADDNYENCHYFGVFDGHGTSALAADLCVDRMYDYMQQHKTPEQAVDESDLALSVSSDDSDSQKPVPDHHTPMRIPSNDAIAAAYKKIDEVVKASRHSEPRSGACAVTLFIEQESPVNCIDEDDNGELNGKVAWVGDCRAFMIVDKNVVKLTKDHRIDDNEDEKQRILNAPHVPRPGLLESELWKREIEKATATGEVGRLRAHSFISRRCLNGQPAGPSCVFSHSGGVSLQVTRSIGDAYAARSVVADPEIRDFKIPKGEHIRFVMGSDGIFDVMSEDDIAKFISKISSPAKAAQKLAVSAKQKRLYSGLSSDDITVLVVDVNPGLRKQSRATLSMFTGK